MGSLEEEKLAQMVDDFIESVDHHHHQSPTSSFPLSSNSNSHCLFTLKEILGNGTKEEEEVGESVMKHLRRWKTSSDANSSKTNSLRKWLVMKLKMEGYDSSHLSHTSWVTSMGCPAGDYEYIEMRMKGERLIIDIEFKAQFEVARATEEYKQLTKALPSVFVGSEEKVKRIISVLCSAAKQSLKKSGLHIPPWRTSTYMHAKWLLLHLHHHSNHHINYIPTNNINININISTPNSNNNNNHNNKFYYWKPPMVN
ncbi:hypothetical protein IC575_025047 [Cucumis melo]